MEKDAGAQKTLKKNQNFFQLSLATPNFGVGCVRSGTCYATERATCCPAMHATIARFETVLAEIQGLYGSFSFPERLLQKIWLRGDFDRTKAVTCDGRPVRVIHPGKWNLLGGPDFGSARLRFSDTPGRETIGDVELHLLSLIHI